MSSEINFEKEKKDAHFSLNPHCGNYRVFLSPDKKIVKTVYSVIAIAIAIVIYPVLSRNFCKKMG